MTKPFSVTRLLMRPQVCLVIALISKIMDNNCGIISSRIQKDEGKPFASPLWKTQEFRAAILFHIQGRGKILEKIAKLRSPLLENFL